MLKFPRTGTKDPLEKEKIEEDPGKSSLTAISSKIRLNSFFFAKKMQILLSDMEDIFRPPEPFNVTTPEKDKNDTSKFFGLQIAKKSEINFF